MESVSTGICPIFWWNGANQQLAFHAKYQLLFFNVNQLDQLSKYIFCVTWTSAQMAGHKRDPLYYQCNQAYRFNLSHGRPSKLTPS